MHRPVQPALDLGMNYIDTSPFYGHGRSEVLLGIGLEGVPGKHTGHVHFADSNRQAIGFGHTDPAPIIMALKEVGYEGYLSAEIFPLPNADAAAEQTIKAFKSLVG